MATSQASVSVDAEGNSFDNLTELSIAPEEIDRNKRESEGRPKVKQRWAFFLRRQGAPASGRFKFKALSVSCKCNSSVKGSCVIAVASFIELIGNLVGLLYGIVFIQGALNFYTLGNDQDISNPKKAQEYDEKFDRILFLENNRVGFVGLLATCVVGLIVAFLMPIGTIHKSWKSLRAAMSLLFSICLAQIFLTSIYLTSTELIASVAVVPFRLYEIFLIASYIRFYKKKKREANLNNGADASAANAAATASSQGEIGAASADTLEEERNIADASTGNEATLNLDLSDGNIIESGSSEALGGKQKLMQLKSKKKRRPFVSAWQKERKPPTQRYETYRELDWK